MELRVKRKWDAKGGPTKGGQSISSRLVIGKVGGYFAPMTWLSIFMKY